MIKDEILTKKPISILEKIEENLEKLNEKMEVMIEIQKNGNDNQRSAPTLPDAPLDVMTLLSMPDHLRKTAMAICRCGRATAEEIAEQTRRARAVESAYLNQLVIMGYLKKERKGRKAYFYVDRETQGLKTMSKIIAVHSYKGGTGKTLLSVNLAATLAKNGKKVCIFDLDFRAPSLFAILKAENVEFWFNDYLNNTCDINKVLVDLSSRIPGNGKFFAGFANPATEAIRDMSSKDRKWEMRALGRLLALKESLLRDQKFDYLFFDTSPGLQYSSINAIVAADFVIVATTADRSDVDGTKRMLQELYNLFEKKTGLVLNKVLDSSATAKKSEMSTKVKTVYQVPMLGIVPCFCEILRAEGNLIFVQDKPDHPFTKIIAEMARKIDNNEVN